MKQAGATLALDKHKQTTATTFNPLLPFVAAAAAAVEATADDKPTIAATRLQEASSYSNKSRARSCFASSSASTFRLNPTSVVAAAAAGQSAENDDSRSTTTADIGHLVAERRSERPLEFSCGEFRHFSNNQPTLRRSNISPTNQEDEDAADQLSSHSHSRNHIDQQQQHQQAARIMSQTIQSIQSLSMQLNRAASLSASLDTDSMSVGGQDMQSCMSASRNAVDSSGAGRLTSGKKLGKLVGKKAGRMKEVLLQNLGKAHKTTDELFEMYEENFYKQQAQAVKIQKEFKQYIGSLKGSQDAAKSLNLCIQQSTGVYQSARHDLVCENLSQLDILNEDLLEKLRGQIQVSLCEYMTQFGELREKILKRKRKLIDYDSSRRVYEIMLANVQRKRQQQTTTSSSSPAAQDHQQHYQALRSLRPSFMMRSSSPDQHQQQSPANQQHGSAECAVQSAASQLVDEARLLKLREQYNYCKLMFETINSELYQELPMVYEKKMKHLLMTLQNYFSLEAQFHSNAGKLFATAGDVIDELPMSIHRAQQQNPLQSQQHQQQASKDEYVASHHHKTSGGSSGVGSSRGDSSLESSSSPDNSVNGSASPSNGRHSPQPSREDAVVSIAAVGVDMTAQADGIVAVAAIEVKQRAASASGEPSEDDGDDSGKDREPVSASVSVDSIEQVLQSAGGDISCQLDSLSMDFGDSSVSDSIDTSDLDALKQQNRVVCEEAKHDQDDDEDQLASASEGSSCSVIEVIKPESEAAAKSSAIVTTGANFLYKVKTSYKYLAEDVDELCFEADEIIQVVEFEENQEQEEGWLMGIREVNGQKGLFPANFTKPLSQ